jgi:hypothetical protein
MALTFGLSGGKILSLSLFSLSRIFSLGGKKKETKNNKNEKLRHERPRFAIAKRDSRRSGDRVINSQKNTQLKSEFFKFYLKRVRN